MLDILIKNGTVVDGTGRPGFVADVGIEGDKIAHIGIPDGAKAETEIDAAGKIVCPGFIDVHSHADLSVFREDHHRLLEPLVRQGITTFIGGNCGFSMAPIEEAHRQHIRDYIEIFTTLDFEKAIQWKTMGGFLDTLESRGIILNAGILAPHGLIRINEMGLSLRYANDDEIRNMTKAVEQALEEGAIGLSTGLQYFPGNQSETRELMELAKPLKKHNGIFTSHLRSYSNTLNLAIDEVIEVAGRNGVPAQISHIFWVPDSGRLGPYMRWIVRGLAGMSKWWTVPLPLERPLRTRINQMLAVRERGVMVGMDVMPTTTGFTHILAFFPPWALTGGREEIIARLRDPEQRKKMRHGIEHGRMVWPHVEGDSWSLNLFQIMGWECARIMSVKTEANKRLEGMSLTDVARERKLHPFDAACDLLLEEDGHVLVFESMAEPEDSFTERAMFAPIRHPEVSISTDTILMGMGKPSHLFYAAYPKFIGRYVREKRMLPLETGIRKCSGLPAEHFGLKGRGRIEKGSYADIVVFDFDRIATLSTFHEPDNNPAGIEHVFINGKHVVDGDSVTLEPRAGRVLRNGGS